VKEIAMARNELFFDPLEGENGEGEEAAAAPIGARASGEPPSQRSLELLRVRDELEKMARAGKRT
jgi:hypothetical protein